MTCARWWSSIRASWRSSRASRSASRCWLELGSLQRDELGRAAGRVRGVRSRARARPARGEQPRRDGGPRGAAAERVGGPVRGGGARRRGTSGLPDETVRDLNLKAAGWYVDHLANFAAAEAAAARRRSPADPESTEAMAELEELLRRPGRERDLVDAPAAAGGPRPRLPAQEDAAARGGAPGRGRCCRTRRSSRRRTRRSSSRTRTTATRSRPSRASREGSGRLPLAVELTLRRARTTDDPRLAGRAAPRGGARCRPGRSATSRRRSSRTASCSIRIRTTSSRSRRWRGTTSASSAGRI